MSSDIAIRVENLSKRYLISHQRSGGDGLRHVLQDKLTAPFRALRKFGIRNAEIGNTPEARPAEPKSAIEEFWALKNVSFEIKRGEVTGIIGRNGAGKSTLLKVLSRITEPTQGRITVEGRVASLLEVGTGFHPELTGRENIFLNGAILGMSRAEIKGKFDEIVAFAEIERFLDTPVKRYSSGMYVRLAFAVAAHLEPEILIVDEVLAVGDAEFQRKCLGKMREVSTQHGRTVLFVSHQMAAVRRLCTQAAVLESGMTDGPQSVDEAIKRYTRQALNTPLDLDVAKVRRPEHCGESARITRVRIAPDTPLFFAKPMEIQYTIKCDRAVRQLAVGMGFDTLEGQRIMTLDSDNSGRLIDLDPGSNEVRVRIEYNPLHPGNYSCGVAVLSGRSVVDALPAFATWEVRSSAADVASDRGFAGCRFPVTVEVVGPTCGKKPSAPPG